MVSESQRANRIKLLDEHIRVENAHDVNATMQTLADTARYMVNGEHLDSHEGIQAFYEGMFQSFPDFYINEKQRYINDEAVILEVVVSGTHQNTWNGVPATGRRVDIPICVVFTFDEKDEIAGEQVYFDTGVVMRQIGAIPSQ